MSETVPVSVVALERLREAFGRHDNQPCPVVEAARALLDSVQADEGEAAVEPVCACGHAKSDHWGNYCGGTHRGPSTAVCPCPAFSPAETASEDEPGILETFFGKGRQP